MSNELKEMTGEQLLDKYDDLGDACSDAVHSGKSLPDEHYAQHEDLRAEVLDRLRRLEGERAAQPAESEINPYKWPKLFCPSCGKRCGPANTEREQHWCAWPIRVYWCGVCQRNWEYEENSPRGQSKALNIRDLGLLNSQGVACPKCRSKRFTLEYFADKSWALCGNRDCTYKGVPEEFFRPTPSLSQEQDFSPTFTEALEQFRKVDESPQGKELWSKIDKVEQARKAAEELIACELGFGIRWQEEPNENVVSRCVAIILKHLAGSEGGQEVEPEMLQLVEPIARAICKVESLDPDEATNEETHEPNWARYADVIQQTILAAAPRPQGDGWIRCAELQAALERLLMWLEDDVLEIMKDTERMGITWDAKDRELLRAEIEKAKQALPAPPTESEAGE